MRRLLLALCLSLPLALPAVAQTPERDPPRDLIVPEGAEGLSPKELARRALEARAAGDIVGWRAFATAAVDAGHRFLALDLAADAYRTDGLAAAAEIERYARLAVSEDPRQLDTSFFWLAMTGSHRRLLGDPQATSRADTDLWYRIVAWRHVLAHRTRSERQRWLEVLRDRTVGDEVFPEAFLGALRETVSWFDLPPSTQRKMAEDFCGRSRTFGAERLCLSLMRTAAERGDRKAMPQAAFMLLESPYGDPSRGERIDIQEWLCQAAMDGRTDALERLAHVLVKRAWPPRVNLAAVSLLLERTGRDDLDAMAEVLERSFGDSERTLYARGTSDDPPELFC